jgi:Tol biopolymer transport system component
MNADGSNLVSLTDNPAVDELPNWSPDGTKIVFGSNRDDIPFGNTEIYVMNADGSGETRLTFNPAFDEAPDWGLSTDTDP